MRRQEWNYISLSVGNGGGGMSHANYGPSVELGLGADAEIPNSATRS